MSMFKNSNKIQKQMRAFPDAAKAEIHKAHVKNGEEADRYMSALVPILTGETKISIFTYVKETYDGTSLTIVAGDGKGAPARIIEFANNQPFFYPVIRLNYKRWRSRINRHINKAAKQAVNGG